MSCSSRYPTARLPATTSSSPTASPATYKDPGRAAHRPSGLAVGPDGALYITDDKAGRIWRVTYIGDPNAKEFRPHQLQRPKPKPRPEPFRLKAFIPMPGYCQPSVPPGATSEQVALGKKIFHGEVAGATCAGCHGADGIGTPVGADLTSGTWLWGDGSLQSITDIIRTVCQSQSSIQARCLLLAEFNCRRAISLLWRPMSGQLAIRQRGRDEFSRGQLVALSRRSCHRTHVSF